MTPQGRTPPDFQRRCLKHIENCQNRELDQVVQASMRHLPYLALTCCCVMGG